MGCRQVVLRPPQANRRLGVRGLPARCLAASRHDAPLPPSPWWLAPWPCAGAPPSVSSSPRTAPNSPVLAPVRLRLQSRPCFWSSRRPALLEARCLEARCLDARCLADRCLAAQRRWAALRSAAPICRHLQHQLRLSFQLSGSWPGGGFGAGQQVVNISNRDVNQTDTACKEAAVTRLTRRAHKWPDVPSIYCVLPNGRALPGRRGATAVRESL